MLMLSTRTCQPHENTCNQVCAHARITHTHTVLTNVEHMQTAAVNHIEILMYKILH